jgi:hypothetical protein
MSPYRLPAQVHETETGSSCPDSDVLPLLVVFWLASVARVIVGFVRHEAAGTEATLASLAVVSVPFLFKEPVTWWWTRRCRRKHSYEDSVPITR